MTCKTRAATRERCGYERKNIQETGYEADQWGSSSKLRMVKQQMIGIGKVDTVSLMLFSSGGLAWRLRVPLCQFASQTSPCHGSLPHQHPWSQPSLKIIVTIATGILILKISLSMTYLCISCVTQRNRKGVVPVNFLCETKNPCTSVFPVWKKENLKVLYVCTSCVK